VWVPPDAFSVASSGDEVALHHRRWPWGGATVKPWKL